MKSQLELIREAADRAAPPPDRDPFAVEMYPPESAEEARFRRELERLNASQSLTIPENVRITPYAELHRVIQTTPCLLPIRVLVTVDGHPEFRVKRCDRWRCNGCRPLKEAELTERIINAFADHASAYVENIDVDTWAATHKQLSRRGVEYVRLTTNQPDVYTLITTSPTTVDAVKVEDLESLVVDLLAKRPKTRGGARFSSSRGFLPSKPAADPVAEDPFATGEIQGTWDHRVTLPMLEEMCEKVGVPFERHRPTKPMQTDRLTVLTEWDDPRFLQVRRWCGFAWMNKAVEVLGKKYSAAGRTLETADDWLTWLMGDQEVPWECYGIYEEQRSA